MKETKDIHQLYWWADGTPLEELIVVEEPAMDEIQDDEETNSDQEDVLVDSFAPWGRKKNGEPKKRPGRPPGQPNKKKRKVAAPEQKVLKNKKGVKRKQPASGSGAGASAGAGS